MNECFFKEYFKYRTEEEANFISRTLGLFAEKLVELWLKSPNCPYENLGRPSFYDSNDKYTHITLDFALRDKQTGEIFVTEMKSEIAYNNFKNVILDDKVFDKKLRKRPFEKFVDLANDTQLKGNKTSIIVKVNFKKIDVTGCILIWNCATQKVIDDFKNNHHIIVITLESILKDIEQTKLTEFFCKKRKYIDDFFNAVVKLGYCHNSKTKSI